MSAAALDTLAAPDVGAIMASFESALRTHREVLNRLNVYPVPDGDTGTNMHLTLESVSRELGGLAEDADMTATCKAISHGSLMGARGNSGVILCQILRGLTATFSAAGSVRGTDLAAGLAEADSAARVAVLRPVEGTILSVIRAAAEAVNKEVGPAANGGAGSASQPAAERTLAAVAEGARVAAVEALWRTPEQLPVLARAGVVDAGGAGLVLLFDAMLAVIEGRELPDELPLPAGMAERIEGGTPAAALQPVGAEGGGRAGGAAAAGAATPATRDGAVAEFDPDAGEDLSDLRYEVMYMLEAPDRSITAFKNVWAGIGDSIVVVGGDGMWNCHIHTNDIGAAVEAALDAGRPRHIRVTDLLEEIEEESWVRRAVQSVAAEPESLEPGPPPRTSVIAVASGVGIGRIFHSLGVRQIVAGGQSMNPSTEQLLSAIDAAPGSEVIILPNNKNIYAVAAQACELSSRPARVVDTPGIQEGFAALLEYDPEAGADSNLTAMAAAADRVVAGEVTQAVRDSSTEAGEVVAGDWIGLSRKGIEVVAPSLSEATIRLLDRLLIDSHEILTVIEGPGARPADTRRITEWLAETHPDLSVELHHGGQPTYPYLISAE